MWGRVGFNSQRVEAEIFEICPSVSALAPEQMDRARINIFEDVVAAQDPHPSNYIHVCGSYQGREGYSRD
jgi:hypothetical protein